MKKITKFKNLTLKSFDDAENYISNNEKEPWIYALTNCFSSSLIFEEIQLVKTKTILASPVGTTG